MMDPKHEEICHLVRNGFLAVSGLLHEAEARLKADMEALEALLRRDRHELVNPTGGNIRSDPAGDGRFGAKRGDRTHRGLDLECRPGQVVYAPCEGFVELRPGRCYEDDGRFALLTIDGKRQSVRILYVEPREAILGTEVMAGDVVGVAQDITLRGTYRAQGMRPHVHMEAYRRGQAVDPEPMLFGGDDAA